VAKGPSLCHLCHGPRTGGVTAFTILTIFICLLIYPFFLAPSIGFHKVKESHRFQSSALEDDAIPIKICLGVASMMIWAGDLSPFLFLLLGGLNVYYLVKIGRAIKLDCPVGLLGCLTLRSKVAKISGLSFIVLLYLTVLENIHVIPTCPW